MENMENMPTEKPKSSKKFWIIAVLGILVVLVAVFVVLLMNNDEKELTPQQQVAEAEKKELNSFKEAMEQIYSGTEGMDLEETKEHILNGVYANAGTYSGNANVEYLANTIINDILNTAETEASKLVESVKTKTNEVGESLLDGLLGEIDENIIVKDLQIKSNTVCEDGDIDAKYCVNKLNAKVYVVDPNSDKWVVMIHGHMMSGSLIYRTVGHLYSEHGYNVIAPDLRGFGSSDGSVAMGYLESLDVYDWIKDLNANYKKEDRYNVKVKPSTIVVHGVSLGGATTLQLATNPDIAASKGEPYTKTLTELNVKGFVDDCGYTSMSGIITGMLSMGDLSGLTSLFESLNIDKEAFMTEFNKVIEQLNIKGFESFDFEKLTGLNEEEISEYFAQFSTIFGQVEEQFKNFELNNGTIAIPGYSQEEVEDIYKKFEEQIGDIQIPGIEDLLPKNTADSTSNGDTSEIIDGVVGKVLMALVGVGLNDDNYDYYSNVFSEGRAFPSGSKVMIIHGTGDTTVPHSNADEVAKNVSPGILVHRWDPTLAPHAFVVIGMNKDEYKELVGEFTKCVADNTCTTINKD